MPPPSVYPHGENLYLNLTALCPTACVFCAKGPGKRRYRGRDLSLKRPPEIEEIWAEILRQADLRRHAEFVFCGFGESTYRLDAVTELGRRLKDGFPDSRRRLNTIGLGSAIWGRDIAPELAQSLNAVSVSLNTADRERWFRLHRPRPEFRAEGFEAALDFIRSCVAAGLETTVTAVELPGTDLGAVERLSLSLGAGFRRRPELRTEDLLEES